MIFLGVIVNAAAIALGSTIGVLLKKGISERIHKTLNAALALGVFYVGITGLIKSKEMIVVVLSLCLGAIIGELIDFEGKLNKFGDFIQSKLVKGDESNFAQGFVASTLLFCIGAMTIVGAIESGMQNSHQTYFTKAILDGVIVILMASTMGIGCLFSAFSVLIYQGLLTLSASYIASLLSDAIIVEMSAVGAIIIIGIALNMLGLTKIKIGNFILAPFIPILIMQFI